VRISDASPIHNSNCNSAMSRSNQRACPLVPCRRVPLPPVPRGHDKTLPHPLGTAAGALAVPHFRYHKRNLLETRVVVTSYNRHVRQRTNSRERKPPEDHRFRYLRFRNYK
jgi:hypothetical protein